MGRQSKADGNELNGHGLIIKIHNKLASIVL